MLVHGFVWRVADVYDIWSMDPQPGYLKSADNSSQLNPKTIATENICKSETQYKIQERFSLSTKSRII